MMCSARPEAASLCISGASTGLLYSAPLSIARVISMTSCSTMRPAPMHMWPSSEVPIRRAGRRPASPEASLCLESYPRASASMLPGLLAAMASPRAPVPMPHPSSEIRTMGSMGASDGGGGLRGPAVDRSCGQPEIFQRGIFAEIQADLVPLAADLAAIGPRQIALLADAAAVLLPEQLHLIEDRAVFGDRLPVLAAPLAHQADVGVHGERAGGARSQRLELTEGLVDHLEPQVEPRQREARQEV